jgi:hypothetical protein
MWAPDIPSMAIFKRLQADNTKILEWEYTGRCVFFCFPAALGADVMVGPSLSW